MSTNVTSHCGLNTAVGSRPFSDTEDATIRQLREREYSWKQIAHALGRSYAGVNKRAIALGLHSPSTRARLSSSEMLTIRSMYADGALLGDIAAAVSRTEGSVSRAVSRMGVANRLPDNGPVRRGAGGTRQCRRCSEYLASFAFASEKEGTCRDCRRAITHLRSVSRSVADGKSARSSAKRRKGTLPAPARLPRVRVSSLSNQIAQAVLRYGGSERRTAEALHISRGRLGEMIASSQNGSDMTCSFDVADRICIAAGSHVDTCGAELIA